MHLDLPFRNHTVRKSGDWRILCCSETPIWSSKIVAGSAGIGDAYLIYFKLTGCGSTECLCFIKPLARLYQTEQFSILDPQNPAICESYVVQRHRWPDFEALKLWNVRSGSRRNAETPKNGSWQQMAIKLIARPILSQFQHPSIKVSLMKSVDRRIMRHRNCNRVGRATGTLSHSNLPHQNLTTFCYTPDGAFDSLRASN